MALRDLFAPKPAARSGQAITAAAKVIRPSDEDEKTRIRQGPTGWQHEAWAYFDELDPISYPATYTSNALGRLRIGAAMRPDPREQPVLLDPDGKDGLDLPARERDALNATIDRLGNGEQPIHEIQRLLSLNLFIAGDGYLIGYPSPDTGEEVWDVVSVEELVLDPNGRGYARKRLPGGSSVSTESLPENTFICRVYQRHPRNSFLAYSSMIAVRGLCEELMMLTDAIRATASSRIPAGVMFLPHGMMGSPSDQTQIGQPDEAANNPVIQRTIEHFETPIKNRKSASAVVPLMLVGEPEDIKTAHVWEPTRAIDETAAKQRQELIGRIALGLDMPAEILTGKTDLNHWSLWGVTEDMFKNHLEPGARVMVNALTTGYFRPHLAKMDVTELNRFFVWYDASDLVSHPNRVEDYEKAYENMEISGEAYLRSRNIPDLDAIDDTERAERLRQKILVNSRVQLTALPNEAQIAGDEPIQEVRVTEAVGPAGQPRKPAPPAAPKAAAETVTPGPPAQKAASVEQFYNENHDDRGRFDSGDGGGKGDSGKDGKGDGPNGLPLGWSLHTGGDAQSAEQYDGTVIVMDKNMEMQGHIDYAQVFPGGGPYSADREETHINMVEVKPEAQGQGVATALFDRMLQETTGPINPGMLTDDGAKWWEAVKDRVPEDRRWTEPSSQAAVKPQLPPMSALAASAAVGPVGPRLAQIEQSLRLRLLQAADDAMQRALERAGNRLRSLANKGGAQMRGLVSDVDAVDVAATLGPDRVAQLNTSPEDLTAGAFDGLYPKWNTWTTRAQEQALAAIHDRIEADTDLGDDELEERFDELDQRFAADREHGWAVLRNGLIALAALQLFSPHEGPPEKGEWADFSVPPGLVRDALITAGGGLDEGGITAGLTSGATVTDAIDTAGLTITSYTWQHGDPARPFEPHEALDGAVFYSDDDEVLANNEGWPDTAYFSPGDHTGCLCEIIQAVEAVPETP